MALNPRKFLTGVDAANQKIVHVATGSDPTDAVNVAQLQAALAGLSWHGAVRVASTTNINLTAPGSTIDGVNMAMGDRFLAKDQATASDRNIYVWQGATSAAVLATDGQQGALGAGAAVYVNEGTVNADTAWTVTTDGAITVGTTALTWNKFGFGVAYTAGAGLKLNGTQFAVDTAVIPLKIATNLGDGTSTSVTFAHGLGTLDALVQVYEVATGATVECDVTRTGANAISLGFAVAPAVGQFRALVHA